MTTEAGWTTPADMPSSHRESNTINRASEFCPSLFRAAMSSTAFHAPFVSPSHGPPDLLDPSTPPPRPQVPLHHYVPRAIYIFGDTTHFNLSGGGRGGDADLPSYALPLLAPARTPTSVGRFFSPRSVTPYRP